MPSISRIDVLVLCAVAASFGLLFHRRVLKSVRWRATVTPLASIIGSGFLILAPILLRDFGHNAVIAMGALCLTSYAMGSAIRRNIAFLDQPGNLSALNRSEIGLEKFSSVVLGFAYVISVCYYLNLLGAFCVSLTPFHAPVHGKIVTTAVLALIGVLGWTRGLLGLEKSEQISVGIKLSIIVGLLVGMGVHAFGLARHGLLQHNPTVFSWRSIRIAFGLLITVQGFETSRYLEEEYNATVRIATMKYSQWISTAIYVVFIALVSVSFSQFQIDTRETAIIQMMQAVAPLLPFLLVFAALASQFSAAVADTNGGGGLIQGLTRGKIPSRSAYVLIVLASVALTWSADIYQIISYASRAFAAYYTLQCALATSLSWRVKRSRTQTLFFAALTALGLAIFVLGIPAE